MGSPLSVRPDTLKYASLLISNDASAGVNLTIEFETVMPFAESELPVRVMHLKKFLSLS